LNKIKSNLYNLLSIVLSILFIYGLVLIINDFDEIFSNISKLNIRVIFTASVVYFVSVYFRYLRWKLIYKELIYLPIRFTAARDLERISPFRGTNPREGALAWALSLSR